MKIVKFEEPFTLFDKWLNQAKAIPSIKEPTAMALATVGEYSKPSLRMVLLKKYDFKGFCFFTNLTSRKGKELVINSNVALCFYWQELGYQIRIEGTVEKVTEKEADDYFASRRRESQIGAWASKQSRIIENDGDFERRILEISQDFKNQNITRPPFWSGFRVKPEIIEFWEERKFRLHKRIRYQKVKNQELWEVSELYP